MQPWRIFDELHIYNFTSNRWALVIGSINSPFPTAGHSASIVGDSMVVFGGRIFNQTEQSYPLSNDVWLFDFKSQEWTEVSIQSVNQSPGATSIKPIPRYGHTQVTLDNEHVLVVGGCGGPSQIFSDVWLLTLISNNSGTRGVTSYKGKWERVGIINPELFSANDFHYYGCKVSVFSVLKNILCNVTYDCNNIGRK
jgi:F-box protein 42